jgi:hypothetical protein
MQRVADILAAWPSGAGLARDIGVRRPTVSAGKRRGSIPAAYWRQIVSAAAQPGYPEIAADLLARVHARRTTTVRSGFTEEGQPTMRGGAAEALVKPLEADATHLTRGDQSMVVSGSNFEVVPARRASSHPPQCDPACGRGSHRNSARAVLRVFVSHHRRLPTLGGIRMLAVNPFTLDDILGSKPS